MKKSVLFIAIVFSISIAKAQLKPYYAQYVLNNYILNPAVTGIENYVDVKIGYRNQWSGIEGAPVTYYATVHGPIGKKGNRPTATSFDMQGSNPYKSKELELDEPETAHHGIGFTAISDKTGYITRTTFAASYAYHIPVSLHASIAAGFMAGATNVFLDKSKIVWANLDPNDPAVGVNNGEIMRTKFEMGAGVWFYGRNFFIGSSVLNIVPGKISLVESEKYGESNKPHLFAQAGYKFQLSNDLSILPSAAILQISPFPTFVQLVSKLQYRDVLWIGGGYSFKDELSGNVFMAGMNIAHTINIGYSYSATSDQKLSAYTGNTHELVIGFLLGNKYGDSCPKNLW